MTGEHLEQEVKLDIRPGFVLPTRRRRGRARGGAAGDQPPGHHLPRHLGPPPRPCGNQPAAPGGGRHGWTLKLPADVPAPNGSVSGTETTFTGGPEEVPSEVLARLVAWTRNALLVPVARLETERRTVILRDADGTTLVEVVDDELSGTR